MPENDFLRCQKNAVNLFCHLEVETMVLNLVFFFFFHTKIKTLHEGRQFNLLL